MSKNDEQEEAQKIKLEALRRELEKGIAELDRGEGIPLDMGAIKVRARELKKTRENQHE